MERAHYIQERSLPELKDFIEKKIFSKDEVRQIVKKRSGFEAALVRRVARKADFLRYIAYEMGLETLRRKRIKRLHLDGPPSISDYALIRKVFFLFERAVAKFKSDLGLWVQYIQVAKKEGARGLASRICARALQLHPTAPSLFILASAHELDQFSPTAARTLLQRGLRLNSDSIQLWTEYLKMELTYIETLRRRWAVLGIDATLASKGKAKEVNPDEALDEESDESRRLVMEGAIVLAVMTAAVKAIPTLELFRSFQSLINTFPISNDVRTTLLDALHSHLAQYLPDSPAAIFLHATRNLSAELGEEELVDALREANELLLKRLLTSQGTGGEDDAMRRTLGEMYAGWVEENFRKIEEPNIRTYLLLSLQNVASKFPSSALSPVVLLTVLTLLEAESSSSKKALKLARKYTAEGRFHPAGNDARVWMKRLDMEHSNATSAHDASTRREEITRVWKDARTSAVGSEEDVEKLWLWAVPLDDGEARSLLPGNRAEREKFFEDLFLSSQATPSASLHDTIIVRYLALTHPSLPLTSKKSSYSSTRHPPSRLEDLKRLLGSGTIRPSSAFWSQAFELEASLLPTSSSSADLDPEEFDSPSQADVRAVRQILDLIYTRWRDTPSSPSTSPSASKSQSNAAEASLAFAEWLLRIAEDGASASKMARAAVASVQNEPGLKDLVEGRWNEVLISMDRELKEEKEVDEVEIRMVLD